MQLIHYLYSPRVPKLSANAAALPHHLWHKANLADIEEAARRACDEMSPDSLAFLASSLQVDEDRFPIHPFDDVTTSSGYVGYWTWELRPALRGTTNLDNLGRFCAHFLLSLEGDDHLPLQLAHFVRDIYSKARKRTEIGTVEFDEIAYRIDSGLVCGYIQFRAGFIREVWDWVREYGSLWLTDAYGPVYFETTSHIIGHHTIKAWQAMIHVAIEQLTYPG